MSWNRAEPYKFSINPDADASKDLFSDLPADMQMTVTTLVRHGSSYLNVLTARINVVHCRDLVIIDE